MFRKDEMLGKSRLLKELEENVPSTTFATFDMYPFYQEDVDRLIEIIKNNTHMISLSLFDCRLSIEQTKLIAKAILLNSTLQEVNIEAFQDDSLELKELLLEVNHHIEYNSTKHPEF